MTVRKRIRQFWRAVEQKSAPKNQPVTGVVTGLSTDSAGVPYRATVQLSDSTLTTTVPILGWNHIGVGAQVTLESSGGLVSPRYRILEVTRAGIGVGSPTATPTLNSPSLVTPIETTAYVGTGGVVLVRADFIVNQIPEQYRSRQKIYYELELRDGVTGKVTPYKTVTDEMIRAQVKTAITDVETGALVVDVDDRASPPASMNFPRGGGILDVAGEHILYDTYNPTAKTFSTLTRGYNGTTAAAHTAGQYVTCLSQYLTVWGLLPGRTYQARVTAVASDGRESNPSAWTTFTTDVDLTAPSWSAGPNLSGTVTPFLYTVTWLPADTNALDLAYYEIRIDDDPFFGSPEIRNVGNGTRFLHEVPNGIPRYYQVRAVDTSGNASDWSTQPFVIEPTDPAWAVKPTPDVVVSEYKFIVSWPPVDVNAEQLGSYEVRHSDDGATWTSKNVGTSRQFVLEAEPGDVRYFQVRPVRWDGDARDAGWSNVAVEIGRGTALINVVVDSSFENGTLAPNWGVIGGGGGIANAAIVTSPVRSGKYALELTAQDVGGDEGLSIARNLFDGDRHLQIVGGLTQPHEASVWVYPTAADANAQIIMFVYWYDASQAHIKTDEINVPGDALNAHTWQQVRTLLGPPAAARYFSVEVALRKVPSDGTAAICYYDDVFCGILSDEFYAASHSAEMLAATAAFLNLPKLRGFWGMGSIDSSGNPQDISGQGRHLANNNAADFGVWRGVVPYVDFNGTNQYLSRGDEAGLDVTGALTIGGWFWRDASSTQGLISKYTGVDQHAYLLYVASDRATMRVSGNGSTDVQVTGSSLSVRRWYFVVGRFTPSSELAVFVNTNKATNTTSIPASIFNSSADLRVGNYLTNYLDGRASFVFLSAAAVDDATILGLYQKTRHLFGV